MIELDSERINNIPIARPRGDIDAANASRVSERVAEFIGNSVERIVIDLSETRYMDSAGIDMLFRLNEHLRQRRGRLVLVIPASSQLARLAELVGLSRAMQVSETLQHALGTSASASEVSDSGGRSPS